MGNGESYYVQQTESPAASSAEASGSINVDMLSSDQIISALVAWSKIGGGEELYKGSDLGEKIYAYYMQQARDYMAYYVKRIRERDSLQEELSVAGYPDVYTRGKMGASFAYYFEVPQDLLNSYIASWNRTFKDAENFVNSGWDDPLGIRTRLAQALQSEKWQKLGRGSRSYAMLFYLARTKLERGKPEEANSKSTLETLSARIDYANETVEQTLREFNGLLGDIEEKWRDYNAVSREDIIKVFTFTSLCFCLQYPKKSSISDLINETFPSDESGRLRSFAYSALPYVRKEGEFAFEDWVRASKEKIAIVSFPMTFNIKTDAVFGCAYFFALHDYEHINLYLTRFSEGQRDSLSEVAGKLIKKFEVEKTSARVRMALSAVFFYAAHEVKSAIDDKILLTKVIITLLDIPSKFALVLRDEFENAAYDEIKLTYCCFFILCDWIDDYNFIVKISKVAGFLEGEFDFFFQLGRMRELEAGKKIRDYRGKHSYRALENGVIVIDRDEQAEELQINKFQRSK